MKISFKISVSSRNLSFRTFTFASSVLGYPTTFPQSIAFFDLLCITLSLISGCIEAKCFHAP